MYEKRPLEKTLEELIEEIAELPQSMYHINDTKQVHFLRKSKKESGFSLQRQECLDELRLYLKYLLFDLDATRRENRYLKKLLDKGQ